MSEEEDVGYFIFYTASTKEGKKIKGRCDIANHNGKIKDGKDLFIIEEKIKQEHGHNDVLIQNFREF